MTSFLQRLFGRGEPDRVAQGVSSQEPLEIEEFGHGLISIPSLDFIGHQAKSLSCRYRLIWADRSPDGLRGGNRETGHSSWSLLRDDWIVTSGRAAQLGSGTRDPTSSEDQSVR